MQSFSIIAALLATATLTVAAPTLSAPVSGLKYDLITREEILERLATSPTDANDVLVKRTAGNIYMCTGGNWGSTCGNVWIPSDQYPTCYTIPEPWFESVGSMGPDTGALYRLTTSSTTGCTTHGDLFLQSPGFSDLYNHDGVDYGHSARFLQGQTCSNCT